MKWITLGVFAGLVTATAVAAEVGSAQELTAAQIVEKNAVARGGLEAWQKVQTIIWVGHIESANAPVSNLSFVLELKRPNKTRFEMKGEGQMGMRIYDGTHGWKLHPTSSGRPELQPYTADELKFAQDGGGIDGPFVDYQAKGVTATLEGIDEVEGHKAYRLKVTLPSGTTHHVWIDAQNFLEIKSDHEARNAWGQTGTVSVLYRNYQSEKGLKMPLLIESGIGTGKTSDKMVIDRVVINPPLDDQAFAKPNVPWQSRRMATVDIRPPMAQFGRWPTLSRSSELHTPSVPSSEGTRP